jgi:glycosyltransferase involved in cell wall biosynthesis
MTDAKCDVSICMPTYNGARYLRSAIESGLAQTCSSFELLVVDDGSTDGTLEIAREFARRDSRIKIHQNPQRLGLAGNWNRCIDLAAGEWIKFLFQDDLLHSECIGQMLEGGLQSGATLVVCDRSFEFEPEVPAAYKERFLNTRNENSMTNRFRGAAGLIDQTTFAAHLAEYPEINCVGEPTVVMFRRSAIEKFGYFNAELIQFVDWEYWARLASNEGLYYIPTKLAMFRIHGGSTTMSNMNTERFRASVLDVLILLHEFVYNAHYAPVRLAARNAVPRMDLARGLLEYYQVAKSTFAQRSNQPAQTAKAIEYEWKRVQSRYPHLRFFSLKYFPARVWHRVSMFFRTARRA